MKILRQVLARVIFLPIILAAGLAATAITAARLMITPEDLKTLVTFQFQEILKRPVRIEWAKFSYSGEIQIKGLRVTEPGPEAIDFITADYIYASYRLLPLLQRKVQIDNITLVSPTIELIKNKDGYWNIGDLFAGYRATGKSHSLNRIARAEIKDGEVFVTDAKAGTRHALESFNLSLNNFKPAGDTRFDVSFFFTSGAFRKPVSGRLYAEGTVNFAGFDWPNAEAKGLRADLTVSGKTASFSGSVKNFRLPELQLKAETPAFKSSELAYLFRPAWNFSAPRADWELSAYLPEPRKVVLSASARPFNLKIDGNFDLTASTPAYDLRLSAPPLSLGLLRSYLDMPVENPAGKLQPRVKITSRGGKAVLDSVFANVTGASFGYGALTAGGLDFTAKLSENLSANSVTASDGRLALGDSRLTGLRLESAISRDELSFEYSGRLDKEPVKGRMAFVNPFSPAKTYYFTGWSKELNYARTKALIFDIIALVHKPSRKGKVWNAELEWVKTLKNSIPTGFALFKLLYKAEHFSHEYMEADDFYLASSLKNFSGDIRKVKGDIYMKAGRGTLFKVDETSEKDRVFYVFTIPLRLIHKMNRMGALKFGYKIKDVSFNSIGGDYSMDKGRLQIRNFYLSGKEFSACAEGWMDFTNETEELKIYTISGKYYTMGGLPEGLTDASGKPALAFTLKGKIGNPDVKVLSARESADMIRAAAAKNPGVDFSRLNALIGGTR